MPPGYPGYPGYSLICFHGLGYPALLNSWAVVIGSLMYGLWIEAALMMLGALWLWRLRALSRGTVFSFGLIAAAALVTIIADVLIVRRNVETCRFIGYMYSGQHYRPDDFSEGIHALNDAIAQANLAFEIAALMFLIGTFAAARVAVLGWRRRAAHVALT
jgi:hypothetical protein